MFTFQNIRLISIISILVNLQTIVSSNQNGARLVLPTGDDPNGTVREQREFVKQMMRLSWDSYVNYSWGWNELSPIARKGMPFSILMSQRMGATIVDSLSTLYVMNMTEEFDRGRDWIQNNLDFNSIDEYISLFQIVIKFVGGLLSAYAFTKEQVFLEKAKEIADKLMPVFNTPTGLQLI